MIFRCEFSRFFQLPRSPGHTAFFEFSRFFRALFRCSFSVRKDESTAPVRAACSAPTPDFRREFLAFFLGRLVNDLTAGVVRASGVLYGCLGVLSERVSSGVILARADARACAGHGESKPSIASLA